MKNQYYLYIALIGTFVACIADIALLYVPFGGYEKWDYTFFNQISQTRLYIGSYLGILFIPFELFGFVVVRQMLQPAPQSRIDLISLLVLFAIIWGIAYHALVATMGTWVQLAQASPISADVFAQHSQTLKGYFEPLGNILLLLFALLSLLMAHTVWKYPTAYPKSMAWLNPFVIYLAIVLIYCCNKTVGSALMVAGFNLSVFIWLLITVYYSQKVNKLVVSK